MRRPLHGILICCGILAVGVGTADAADYVWKDGKWVAAPTPAEGTPAGELALIRSHVDAGERKKALAAAERFVEQYPDSPLREEALLLAGQAELDAGRYYQAYERLEEMIAAFPSGQFLERALTREMEAGNAFLAGEKRIVAKIFRLPAYDEGLKILRGIVEHAPGSAIAEKAMMRIGDYYVEDGQFTEAADAYDEYLQLFPQGARNSEAMRKGAQAMRQSFKGVPYDETPLVEAEHRYKALRDQYPAVARKARADAVLREIAEIRAERTYETARFYERTDRPKSAKFYYEQVVRDYPSSAWASAARGALGGAAADVPAKPAPKPAPKSPPKSPPKTKPAEEPAEKPEPAPAPKAPKAPSPPAQTQPAPTSPAKPVDLEKLPEPSPKGQSS